MRNWPPSRTFVQSKGAAGSGSHGFPLAGVAICGGASGVVPDGCGDAATWAEGDKVSGATNSWPDCAKAAPTTRRGRASVQTLCTDRNLLMFSPHDQVERSKERTRVIG